MEKLKKEERAEGFEPSTFCLGSRRSTTEPCPQVQLDYRFEPLGCQADCVPVDRRRVLIRFPTNGGGLSATSLL